MILSGIVLILLCLFIYFNKYFKVDGLKPWVFPSLFLLKVIFAIIVWYYYYYIAGYKNDSDMYEYFNKAEFLYLKLKNSPLELIKVIFYLPVNPATHKLLNETYGWNRDFGYGLINDNRIMFRLNLFIRTFSQGHYFAHLIVFTFIGFTGLLCLVKTYVIFQIKQIHQVVILVFLIPSSLFWLGGIYKESLLMVAIGGILFHCAKLIYQRNFRIFNISMLLFFIFISVQVKPIISYLFLSFIFSFLLFKVIQVNYSKLNLRLFFLLIFSFGAIILILSDRNTRDTKYNIKNGDSFHFIEMLTYKQDDFLDDSKAEDPSTFVAIPALDGSYSSLIKSIPSATSNIFLFPLFSRPIQTETLPFIIESSLLFIGVLLLILFRKPVDQNFGEFSLLTTYFSIISLLLLGILIPILGLTIKYKSVLMPMLFATVFLQIDWKVVLLKLKIK